MNLRTLGPVAMLALAVCGNATVAMADKLDDILSVGELKCSIPQDFPPISYRNEANELVGFDIDYCNDLAASLGVTPVLVEVTWADRIPSLLSDRADVSIADASDTLERAQTVGFSIPYMAYTYEVAVRKGSDIKTFDDLKGRKVATVVSTTNETLFLKAFDAWADPAGEHLSLQSEADMFLALEQGKVDAIISGNTAVTNYVNGGKFPNIERGPVAPFPADIVAIMAKRQEYGWINYLDLFVHEQVRSGRYAELYGKWVGGEVPDLTINGVYR
jgi:hydroxyproline transporter system substrate-binding protein